MLTQLTMTSFFFLLGKKKLSLCASNCGLIFSFSLNSSVIRVTPPSTVFRHANQSANPWSMEGRTNARMVVGRSNVRVRPSFSHHPVCVSTIKFWLCAQIELGNFCLILLLLSLAQEPTGKSSFDVCWAEWSKVSEEWVSGSLKQAGRQAASQPSSSFDF